MLKSIGTIAKIAIAAVAIGGVTAPAMAQGWDRDDGRFDRRYDDRSDRDWDGPRGGRYELQGPGVGRLHPILKTTPEGMRFARQFDYNRDGRLSWNEGAEANRALMEADRNRDAFVSDREAMRFLR